MRAEEKLTILGVVALLVTGPEPKITVAQQVSTPNTVEVTVADDTGAPVRGAIVTIQVNGRPLIRCFSDLTGQVTIPRRPAGAYHIILEKSGFYPSDISESDPSLHEIHVVLTQMPMLVQQVDVNADANGLDSQQLSDKLVMGIAEIQNVPFPTSRDIRQILQYYPGVVLDNSGQPHVAGSAPWQVLDLLDGFDVRSPFDGTLSMRFSADSVRSIEKEATRYPVLYGRNTGGVIAFNSGMGDDKFRFNVTDFLPQFEQMNGLRFDKFVPRLTVSGPIRRNRIWFFDGVETEFLQHYVAELQNGSNSNLVSRGSNFFRAQWNEGPQTVVKAGLVFNDFHSPYTNLAPNVPRDSTIRRNTIAWLPYTRIQETIGNSLLDLGLGVVRFSDSSRPYGEMPYVLNPESSHGSYFETRSDASESVETNANFYMGPRTWLGIHDVTAGAEINKVGFDEFIRRAPVDYLREDKTLLRRSTFLEVNPFGRHNLALGAFLSDHWTSRSGLLIQPGLRLDWNEVTRRPEWSPRISVAAVPKSLNANTKIAAGIGIYYEHTQMEYLARALAGIRQDTYYASDGVTSLGAPLQTTFLYNQHSLRDPYAINWSVGFEQHLPARTDIQANYIRKRVIGGYTYSNVNGPNPLSGTYLLTNSRDDRVSEFEIGVTHTFRGNYTLSGAYTHATTWTNAALDYLPAGSLLGTQRGGPLDWDVPDTVVSYGWLPLCLPRLRKNWDFVYTFLLRTGFPYSAINANHEIVGAANSHRYPDFLAFNPGVEWKFHFNGAYFGLRTVIENATDSLNPLFVNNVIDSPSYGRFGTPPGRNLSVRLRLIDSGGKSTLRILSRRKNNSDQHRAAGS